MTDGVTPSGWDAASPLERERRRCGLSFKALGELLGRTGKSVARYCAPVGRDDFSRPDERAMIAIYVWSGGRITPNDFYDLPTLNDLPSNGEVA